MDTPSPWSAAVVLDGRFNPVGVRALAAGDKPAAIRHMDQFVKQVGAKVTDAAVRTLLERDGRAVIAGLRA